MIKIRQLKRKDLKTIENIIKKFSNKINNDQLLKLFKSSSENINENKEEKDVDFEILLPIFKDILKALLDIVEEDLIIWFADLLGCTIEEYQEKELDIDLKVIDLILEQEGAGNFFTGASALFKKIKKYVVK